MGDKKHIFMVEDDRNFGMVMRSYLEINGFKVTWEQDGEQALKTFKKDAFDFCILDVMIPNVDGFTIGRKIKQLSPELPFIFLTAKTLKEDILEGYDIGADEYISKPFDSEILVAKIKAILNRQERMAKPVAQEEMTIGSAVFNYKQRTITSPEQTYRITPKEAELLKMLYNGEDNILQREDALSLIWGENNYFTTRSMDVYISKLRKYFAEDPNIEIINIHGTGYMLKMR